MNRASVSVQRAPRVLLAWLAVPVLLALCFLAWSLLESCANTTLTEVASPRGDHKAVLFERSCTGTIAWATHVSVLGAGSELPNERGNALVSFERHGSLLERQDKAPEVQARWLDESTLELRYPEGTPLQWSVPAVQGVKVVHAPAR